MKDKKSIVIVLIVSALFAAVVGAALMMNGNNGQAENTSSTEITAEDEAQSKQAEPNAQPAPTEATPAASTKSVSILNYAYEPKSITIKVGDTVTWTNQDTVSHDVTSDDGINDGPSSELLGKGESYSFKFTKAGTYTYHCSPHPYMKGTVVVTE